MNRALSTFLLSLCTITSINAQALKQQGTTVEAIVPKGWEHEEAEGDLNKDGIADLVIVATPNFKENMKSGRHHPTPVHNCRNPISQCSQYSTTN